MTDTTFESISDAGRAIVAAHKKKKGFEEGIRKLLSELYPDNAHFIYELLQNAEDAKASVVEFELHNTDLEVRHNGSRLFSLSDIDSITNIGDSTKKDDPTQIGKFGVGFKAVYSYTSRPEVRSGEYSFAIEDLFINQRIDGDAPPGLTTFRFPFDHPAKQPDVAVSEVARGLEDLDEKTLLFLKNVTMVTYSLPDGTVGIIERKDHDGRSITIQKSQGDHLVESHWLRLVGPASVEHDGPTPLFVGAAFQLEYGEPLKQNSPKSADDDQGEHIRPRSIVPLRRGDVSIYFPAVKETSGLRFHIHAPFASTVARDSVRDDPGNAHLVGDIAALIVDALPGLCDEGLIDDGFLATLPNPDDVLGNPYELIRERVIEAFNELAITPARGSGYAPARSLVSSPVEFRKWLEEGDLPLLLTLARANSDIAPRWIRSRDGRAGKFLASLGTIEFEWTQLDSALWEVRTGRPNAEAAWVAWLATKSDDAICNLYQFLGLARSSNLLKPYMSMERIPIVRLIRRGKVEHVKGVDTYLPASRTDSVQARVPVHLAYFDDDEDQARATNLRTFYNAAGVHRWDESARIQSRLKHYSYGRPIPDGDDVVKHLDDVRAFTQFAKSDPQYAEILFRDAPFLLSPDPDGGLRWINPESTYLDHPFVATGLSALYAPEKSWFGEEDDEYEWEEPDRSPVAGIYLDIDNIVEFLELVGCQTRVEIQKSNDIFSPRNPQLKYEWWAYSRRSAYTETVDWDIEGLDQIIATGDPDLLRTLWRAVVDARPDPFRAVYRANNSAPRHYYESRLVQKLKSERWLLDRSGELKLPAELTVDDLPQDWPRPAANSPVHKLGFGALAAQRHQKAEGFRAFLREEGLDEESLDVMFQARDAGVPFSEIRDLIEEFVSSRRFPEASSDDPARRFAVAAQDALDAPTHETELRLRSVVDGQGQASAESKAYLVGQYTTNAGEMFCQACHKLLPFKVNGKWYFESVRFVPARKQVHPANAVALCPLCAALYKNTRGTSNEALLEALTEVTIAQGQSAIEIPVLLDDKRVVVRFTGKHAIDLQAALGVAGDPRSSPQP